MSYDRGGRLALGLLWQAHERLRAPRTNMPCDVTGLGRGRTGTRSRRTIRKIAQAIAYRLQVEEEAAP